jgi:hypothetical protein
VAEDWVTLLLPLVVLVLFVAPEIVLPMSDWMYGLEMMLEREFTFMSILSAFL